MTQGERPDERAVRTLTVFADFVCPYSYQTVTELDAVAPELGLSIEWRAFELIPAPMPTSRPRTRKAHEAVKFAAQSGQDGALRRAIFDAFFEHARDIGRIDVLVEIGAGVGLDRSELKVVLDVDSFTDAVIADRERAADLEIVGTPAYVAGDDVRVGYMTPAHLREWLGS